MQARAPENTPRRIAVILEPWGSNRSLLDVVLPLLGRDKALEMQGVFLEEAQLRHAADLPFVKELCRVTFSVREFNTDQFERALALRMRTAQRALSVLAKRAGIAHTFHNVRGPAVSLLIETAKQSDITIFEPARTISATIASTPRRQPPTQYIVAVLGDLESGRRTLLAASHLASGDPRRVSVVLSSAAAKNPAAAERLIRACLSGPPARVRTLAGTDAHSLIESAVAEGAAMLVLDATGEWMEPDTLRRLRHRLRCPICLVRDWFGDG